MSGPKPIVALDAVPAWARTDDRNHAGLWDDRLWINCGHLMFPVANVDTPLDDLDLVVAPTHDEVVRRTGEAERDAVKHRSRPYLLLDASDGHALALTGNVQPDRERITTAYRIELDGVILQARYVLLVERLFEGCAWEVSADGMTAAAARVGGHVCAAVMPIFNEPTIGAPK